MPLRDRNIEWLRKHVFVKAQEMACRIGTAASVNTGTPSLVEITTANVVGFELDAAAESVSDIIMLPFDMDPSFTFKLRIHYTGKSTTAADTYTWIGLYNNVKSAALIADPATALDTTFGAANTLSGTAYQIGRTSWGVIVADKWTRAEIEVGHLISLDFDLSASDATLASEQVYFIGYEFSYVQQQTRGSGSVRDLDAA